MAAATPLPWWAALQGRLGDQLADPGQIAVLQERLQRHGAELQAQLPELLLRSPDPQASIEAWLVGRDLSHWQPQAWVGSAADGWQFEAAVHNRARGAEPMNAGEISGAHLDGGLDALLTQGVPEGIALVMAEAALIAAALQLAWLLLHARPLTELSPADANRERLQPVLTSLVGSALQGAACSLVVSTALALVPGGQLWLPVLTTTALLRDLPRGRRDPFRIPAAREPPGPAPLSIPTSTERGARTARPGTTPRSPGHPAGLQPTAARTMQKQHDFQAMEQLLAHRIRSRRWQTESFRCWILPSRCGSQPWASPSFA